MADGVEVDYKKDYFDCVIDSCVIYSNTISDIKKMYNKVFDILKDGGKLLTIVFDTKSTGYGTGVEIEENTFDQISEGALAGMGRAHFFERNEISEILNSIGFKNITCDRYYREEGETIVSGYNVYAEK